MRQSNPLTVIKNKLVKTVRKLEEAKDSSNTNHIKKTVEQIIIELSEEINKLP